jgi:hypothetical protein
VAESYILDGEFDSVPNPVVWCLARHDFR